jgi:hypothetical protein
MMLLDTWVPDDSAKPHAEICHAFVYRWLIGRQKMSPDARSDPVTGPFNGAVMNPILWPAGGQPVRVAGVNQVKAGDIVGFFAANGDLVHSMVAETPTQWVGANNTGCFGVPTGRRTICNIYHQRFEPKDKLGWLDEDGNLFKTTGGDCTVVCRTP